MQPHYRRLVRRMIIIALAASLVPLYLMGAAGYWYFAHLQKDNLKQELRNLALNRVNAVQLFLAERTSMLEVLAHTSTLKQLVEPGALGGIFNLLNRRAWSFLDLGVIDQKGKHLVYVGPYPLEDRQYADTEWFQQTMVRGVYVSDVFTGFRGVPHFVAAVRQNDIHPWVLRATIDSDVFTRLVRSAQLGRSGDAYIVNRQGFYQTPPRFGGKILERAELDPKQVPPGINVVERRGSKGRALLTAYAWLPKENWLLVINQDPDHALGVLGAGWAMALAAGLGTGLIVLVVFYLVSHLVRQLEGQDQERAVLEAQLAHSGRLVSLGRMAAGVAHEINNPLAAISELAGLMEDLMDPEVTAQMTHGELFKENVIKIQEHVDRARSVTHRLLGFARRMEPHWEQVDVNQVTEEAFSFLEKEAFFKSLTVERQLAEDLPLVESDRAQLQQVILNLLDNAVDAVGQGGRVVIASSLEGERVLVSVSDNGPGIPSELQGRIMDPFFTTKAPGEGTGLGLSICHSITQNLGGELSFSSQPGQGSTFMVRLPVHQDQSRGRK